MWIKGERGGAGQITFRRILPAADAESERPRSNAEVLPARRGELKKHVGAVHVKGQLSLLQRKVSNVLLLRAYEDLPNPEVFEHEIKLKTLAEVAGFDSNDHALLREALESLAGTTITWNLLDEEGAEEWGVSTFLAQAVVKNGTCRYAYAPDLRRKLYNPEIYARINLSVQERFGSGYALALYENCVRFRRVGSTGWISLDRWRDLLGVEPGQYEAFKYLNRDVLKPAVEEVNRYSDIRVEMDRKREKRRVVALKFSIHENDQLALDLEGSASRAAAQASAVGEFPQQLPDPRALAPDADALLGPLQRRLVTFGLSQAQALDLSTEFDADRVTRNLDHVEREIERRRDSARPVDRVAAFTIDAVRNDYAATAGTPPVVQEAEQKKARRETRPRRAAPPARGAEGPRRPGRAREGRGPRPRARRGVRRPPRGGAGRPHRPRRRPHEGRGPPGPRLVPGRAWRRAPPRTPCAPPSSPPSAPSAATLAGLSKPVSA